MNIIMKGPFNPKYKTMICKNFTTEQGCQYGDKCQFAHGPDELRPIQNSNFLMQDQMIKPVQQLQKNILNYKIVKCKNFERDGNCKYGALCSFAHGDAELRKKGDTNIQMGPMPIMFPPGYVYDYSMLMGGIPQGNGKLNFSQMDPNMLMQLKQMQEFNLNMNMNQMGQMPQPQVNEGDSKGQEVQK